MYFFKTGRRRISMTKSMTSGNPAKLILLFALPLIAGNIFQQMYSMADTVIVGRTIGVNALAAVGCTGSLTFLILGFVMGFTQGLSIITAQKFGARDMDGVKKSFALSMILSATVAITATILAFTLARPMLVMLHTPDEIIGDAQRYLQVIFAGMTATMFFNFVSNMMRALGDSRTPLYFLVLTCGVNIVLDFTLILFFHMGVEGAAFATIFSQLLSGILCYTYVRKKMPALWISRHDFVLNKDEIILHLRTAFPMAFQMSVIAIGAVLLQSVLNGLGALSVASYTAAQKIDSIATFPLNSLGAAMATYSAQNYGAGRMDRVRKGVFQCSMISISVAIVMGAVNIFFGANLAAIFVGKGETEVLHLAHVFLRTTGIFYWILGLLFIFRCSLQGMGHNMVPVVASVVELVSRGIGAVILARYLGFQGVCIANILAWITAGVLQGFMYFWYMREKTPDKTSGLTWGFGHRKLSGSMN